MTESLAARRPITDTDRQGLIDVITGGLVGIIVGNPGVFFDRPGFIAGGGSDQPFANSVRSLTQLNCRLWASSNKEGYSAQINAEREILCGPYLQTLGEKPSDGSVAPEYEGGQCSTSYTGYATIGGVDISQGGLTPRMLAGPLGAVTRTSVVNNVPVAGGTLVKWVFGSPADDNFIAVQYLPGFGPAPQFRLQRTDGAPDNCGNRPADNIRPPATVTPSTPVPPSIEVNLPGFGPVNVSLTLDADGNPVFCVEELDVCFGVDTTAPPATPPGPNDLAPGDQGTAGTAGDTGEGGAAEGGAGEGEVLVGLKFRLLASPAEPSLYAPGVYRGAAYIYMGAGAGLDQDYAGSMLSDGQFVFAEKDNLTKWRVSSNYGYNWRITPYYRIGV